MCRGRRECRDWSGGRAYIYIYVYIYTYIYIYITFIIYCQVARLYILLHFFYCHVMLRSGSKNMQDWSLKKKRLLLSLLLSLSTRHRGLIERVWLRASVTKGSVNPSTVSASN